MGSNASTSYPPISLELEAERGHFIGIERAERSKDADRGELFPALPDGVTINLILPRLSWRAMIKLTQLNHAWQEAVRSPEVYDARARASTSHTIVTLHQYECVISLYDTVRGIWHRLPRPPFGHMLVARGCCCVTLHGKLYILGGDGEDFLPRNDVHMFELAGQGRWKQCASMKTPRKHFACSVYDGKIYVFGGIGAGNAAEVYNPKQDLWHDIAPMLTHRKEHKVVAIDDAFCVHMGRFLESSCNDTSKSDVAHFAEIYDPRKDHWTAVANFEMGYSPMSMPAEVAETAVVIDGKLHRILDDCLYVYEEPLDSQALKWDGSGAWKFVQRISWDVFEVNYFTGFARGALAISNDGELLALVYGQTSSMVNNRRWTFLKSQALGSVFQKLKWERIEGSARSISSGGSSWKDDFPFAPCMSTIAGAW